MWKFEQSFKKVFVNKDKFYIEKVEKIMMLEDYVTVPAKHIAIEIILNNNKPPMLPQYMFWALFQFTIPVAVSYIMDTPFFANDYHYYVFWLQFPTQLFMQLAMFMLFNSMN